MKRQKLTKAEAEFLDFLKERINSKKSLSNSTMAAELGKSRFWIIYLINRLITKKYIKVIERHKEIIII